MQKVVVCIAVCQCYSCYYHQMAPCICIVRVILTFSFSLFYLLFLCPPPEYLRGYSEFPSVVSQTTECDDYMYLLHCLFSVFVYLFQNPGMFKGMMQKVNPFKSYTQVLYNKLLNFMLDLISYYFLKTNPSRTIVLPTVLLCNRCQMKNVRQTLQCHIQVPHSRPRYGLSFTVTFGRNGDVCCCLLMSRFLLSLA